MIISWQPLIFKFFMRLSWKNLAFIDTEIWTCYKLFAWVIWIGTLILPSVSAYNPVQIKCINSFDLDHGIENIEFNILSTDEDFLTPL